MQELEGTWEEIILQSTQLAGHRVRVTVLDKPEQGKSDDALRRFLADVEKLQPDPAPPKPTGHEAAYADRLAQKFRKQGLKL
jgi:hypothetical protein